MSEFTEKLNKYAELTIKMGVNLKKDQKLVINAPVNSAGFVRMLAENAYAVGARDVQVEWSDDYLRYLRFNNVSNITLSEYPSWIADGHEKLAKEGAAFLYVSAPNPGLLKDIEAEKIAIANKASRKANKNFSGYLDRGEASWCVVAISTPEWAKKVFPEKENDLAVADLWETIFKICRVDGMDPVKSWEKHIEEINKNLDFLNCKRYKKLLYTSPGTELEVGLPENHIWVGGGSTTVDGTYFIPNIPTEEVFTMPLRVGVNGTLKATKPLNYGGKLIEGFSFEFRNGEIVKIEAEKGQEMLEHLIKTDKGSHYLGEVAIVPHDSPISNTNLMFFETLFDENASCHFAIGAAYPMCLENGTRMNEEELIKAGVNISLTHVDFMIGSEKLKIEGVTEDDKKEIIMINGNWAI